MEVTTDGVWYLFMQNPIFVLENLNEHLDGRSTDEMKRNQKTGIVSKHRKSNLQQNC
jgi:hypothetical protein